MSTDLGGDPDDIQSLYRLIHYSDILRVEGIVSSPGPGAKNSAAKVKDWIKRVDPDYLRRKGHPLDWHEGRSRSGSLVSWSAQPCRRPTRPG